MNILDEIIDFKKIEVAYNRKVSSIEQLRGEIELRQVSRSLKERLINGTSTGVIAEFKRKSPSKKDINLDAPLEDIVKQYEGCNCAGISVLTDERFFGGSLSDLRIAREEVKIPILRKDFIIDEFQLYEAKRNGADVILLIAACLSKNQIHDLAHHACALGLEVLLEVHSADELDKVSSFVDIIGVNNRDLKTFTTSIQSSIDLFDQLPDGKAKISESGIHSVADAIKLFEAGFHGLLIGEQFMKDEHPGTACQDFTKELVYQKMISQNSSAHG